MRQAPIPFLAFLCVHISSEEVKSQHMNGADTELSNSPEVSCPVTHGAGRGSYHHTHPKAARLQRIQTTQRLLGGDSSSPPQACNPCPWCPSTHRQLEQLALGGVAGTPGWSWGGGGALSSREVRAPLVMRPGAREPRIAPRRCPTAPSPQTVPQTPAGPEDVGAACEAPPLPGSVPLVVGATGLEDVGAPGAAQKLPEP